MRTYILLFLIITFISACKKDDIIDPDEGQSNWTKIVIDNIDFNHVISSNLICDINDICFIDNKTGFIIGCRDYRDFAEVVFKTDDGGETWMLNKKGWGYTEGMVILFATQTNGFSVKSVPTKYTILDETNDGGTTWFEYDSYDSHDVYVPSGSAFRIDALSLILGNLKSKDGGDNWQILDDRIFGPYYFRDINYGVFFDYKYNGLIMETYDFCETWDTIFDNDLYSFSCIQMIDSNTIIAGGDKIIRSSDKGLNWQETYSDQFVNDIKFIDNRIGFAACGEFNNGSILKTTDGGISWAVNYSSEFMNFTSLFIIDTQTIIAAGNQCINENDLDKATYIVKTTTQGE